MEVEQLITKYGSPDIEVGCLRFWIHGRQFPNGEGYWDGNWLNATVHCGAEGADVWVEGNFMHVVDLKKWAEECQKVLAARKGRANLNCVQPELGVRMEMKPGGQVETNVKITADLLRQTHEFDFFIDISALPKLIRECSDVMVKYPLRGAPPGK